MASGDVELTLDELAAGDDPAVGLASIEAAGLRATPVLVEVLGRYPAAPAGRSRPAVLLAALDAALRDSAR